MSRFNFYQRTLRNFLARRPLNSSTEIRITHLCTQRCRQCQVYERRTQPPSLSLARFQILAERLRHYGAAIGFISGGEATLAPDLEPILNEAKRTFPLATTLVTGLYNRTDIIERIARVALDEEIHIQTSLDGLGEIGDVLRGAKNFAATVLAHMALISRLRQRSKSLLYANIVLNNLNLHQVPTLIQRATDLGWRVTIGVYHHLTATTRADSELKLVAGPPLRQLIDFLTNNPQILNLNAFITGIPQFVATGQSEFCAFTDAPILATRLTIMEDGAVHLCWGEPIGNIFEQELLEIFQSPAYRQRLSQYEKCAGCWTTCYSQRYLLTHPKSVREGWQNLKKVLQLRRDF